MVNVITHWATSHSSIFKVSAVVSFNWQRRAIKKICLIPCTLHLVQPDRTSSIGDISEQDGYGTIGLEPQLPAGHLRIGHTPVAFVVVPAIVTHCAPGVIVTELQTALVGSASTKPDLSFSAQDTPHSSVLQVGTLADSKLTGLAVHEPGLIASAIDPGQPDQSSAIGNLRTSLGDDFYVWESQLPACHKSIRSIPVLLAHCAPDVLVADLHTPTGCDSSLKPDGSLGAEHDCIFVTE